MKTKQKHNYHLRKPLQLAGEIVVGFLAVTLPYYCGEVFEGYIMQTNTKGMSSYEILHLEKNIDFGYAIAALVTVELGTLMLKQLWRTLDWRSFKPKKRLVNKNITATMAAHPKWQLVWHFVQNISSTLIMLILAVIPYNMATEYENYVMHLNVAGQSPVLVSHLTKTVYFGYLLAAAVTIKIIVLFIVYAKQHFGRTRKGSN